MSHNSRETKETCRRIDVKKNGILLIVMIAYFCILFAGCNTMLTGDLSVEYVPDTSGEDNKKEFEEVSTDGMIPETEKYASSYPDAFAFLEGHSTNPEELISFEILEFTNDNTFVYAYQTIDKSSSTEDHKVMASVLMSYNYKTKETKVFWKLTSSVTDSKSFFAQPIYQEQKKGGITTYQCTGYLAYFKGRILIYSKTRNDFVFDKDISSNLDRFFEKYRDKNYNSGSYEISEITADGDFTKQLNLHMKLVIISKNIDKVLEGEPVPSVTYAPSELTEEDTDVDEAAYGIKNYTVLYTITSLGRMSFESKNLNLDNQLRNWIQNGNTGGYGDFFGDCITSNGTTLVEMHGSTWEKPYCASGNTTELENFKQYSHMLKRGSKEYYEIYGRIETCNQIKVSQSRTVTTKDSEGKEVKHTETASFVYSNIFTFADSLYGISCSVIDEDASYAYLYGNYIIKYQKNKLMILKSVKTGVVDQNEIYDWINWYWGNNNAKNEITMAEGIFLEGEVYAFATDNKFLYLYDMDGSVYLRVPVDRIYFPKVNGEVTVTPTSGDSAENPDIYRARSITKIGDNYYFTSIFSGLSTGKRAYGLSNLFKNTIYSTKQLSTYSCYGIYPQGSSYIVIGYDNDEPVYTEQDIIRAKCIPLNKFYSR